MKSKLHPDLLMKYIHMSRPEEIRMMNEAINGKPHYSDSMIAFGLALLAITKN